MAIAKPPASNGKGTMRKFYPTRSASTKSETSRRTTSLGKPKLPSGAAQIKAEDTRRAKSAGMSRLPASNSQQVRAEDKRKAKNPANPNHPTGFSKGGGIGKGTPANKKGGR